MSDCCAKRVGPSARLRATLTCEQRARKPAATLGVGRVDGQPRPLNAPLPMVRLQGWRRPPRRPLTIGQRMTGVACGSRRSSWWSPSCTHPRLRPGMVPPHRAGAAAAGHACRADRLCGRAARLRQDDPAGPVANRSGRRVAWVTLDPHDNDPAVLLAYLAVALDRIQPIDPGIFHTLASPGSHVVATVVPGWSPSLPCGCPAARQLAAGPGLPHPTAATAGAAQAGPGGGVGRHRPGDGPVRGARAAGAGAGARG
jgi:hypothetical protein